MVVGLQVFDEAGRTILDEQTYTAKVLGTLIIKPNTNGKIKHKKFTEGTPFCVCNPLGFFQQWRSKIDFSGDTMTWSYTATIDEAPDIILTYGVR